MVILQWIGKVLILVIWIYGGYLISLHIDERLHEFIYTFWSIGLVTLFGMMFKKVRETGYYLINGLAILLLLIGRAFVWAFLIRKFNVEESRKFIQALKKRTESERELFQRFQLSIADTSHNSPEGVLKMVDQLHAENLDSAAIRKILAKRT